MSLLRVSRFHDLQATDRLGPILFIILHWLRHYYYLSRCFVTCRHFENNSDRLFKKFFFFAFISKSFSSRHKLHRFDPALYAATCFIMDHLMWWSPVPIFNFQMFRQLGVIGVFYVSERFGVVAIPLFEIVGRYSYIVLSFSVVCCRYFGLVDQAPCQTISSDWAFIRSSAVAFARFFVCCVVLCSIFR